MGQISKRKKGIFGPPSGQKLLFFIDDLNMPKKEIYGAQRPIELIRQYLDHQGWYFWNLNKEYIRLEDIMILGGMGVNGGVTERFTSHFNILCYTELDDKIIKSIFNTILSSYL